MTQLGTQLRVRARDLGLADAEVARRAGLTERRYGHYVSGTREPNLATLLRICQVLRATPNELLGVGAPVARPNQRDRMLARLAAAATGLRIEDLGLLTSLVDVWVAHRAKSRSGKDA
jgi:transcriptional regulator with XRE-family HTH domain